MKKISLIVATILATNISANEILDKVIITATKSQQSIKNITSNVEIITSENLQERHISTVTEALNLISGINFTNNGGFGQPTAIYLRGFDSKRVLVLIDGIRYNDISSANGASFENLIVSDIKQIEIIKGAESGIWGADASAGVINIVTKNSKIGNYAYANLEYGTFNTKKYGATFSHKDEKFDIRVGANKIQTDGFSAFAKKDKDIDSYEDDSYKNETINIKASYNINEQNSIKFSHRNIDVYGEYDSFDGDSNDSYTKKEKLSQIVYQNSSGFALSEIYVNHSLFERDYSAGFGLDGEIYEYGAKSDIKYNESDFVVIGADYKSFKHKSGLNKKFDNDGIFITNSNIINSQTIISESLRFDSYDAFSNKLTGKFGVKHNFNSDFYSSFNIGTAYNVPTPYQLYDISYGNSNLGAEDTSSYDISLGYKNFEITYFNSRVRDIIDYDFATSKYANIDGISKIKGFEIDYKRELIENLYATISYTNLDAKDSKSQKLARRPKDSVKLGLDYYLNSLHLGLVGEYIGERYDKANEAGEQTGKYVVANFITNYEFSDNFNFYGKIDNITDEKYQVVDNYATSKKAYYVGVEAKF